MNDTAFKVVDGLIELTEDITLEGYDEAYTFAGATTAEITRLNGVTHPIQTQIDEVNTELDALNTELDSCIKMGENTLTSDVTLTGGHTFCGATSSEIASLSRVTSNIQTQCDNAIKRISTTALLGDVTLSGYGYKFC